MFLLFALGLFVWSYLFAYFTVINKEKERKGVRICIVSFIVLGSECSPHRLGSFLTVQLKIMHIMVPLFVLFVLCSSHLLHMFIVVCCALYIPGISTPEIHFTLDVALCFLCIQPPEFIARWTRFVITFYSRMLAYRYSLFLSYSKFENREITVCHPLKLNRNINLYIF